MMSRKAANVVCCRQKWRRHFRVGVKPCWASQIGKDPERILGTVQSSRIAGVKRNVLLYKGKNSKAPQMESMQHVSLFGRPYPNIVHNVQSPALK